ncbi:MAG: flavodoxin family protein, partial [Oscillospiraceae bacterium]
MKIVIINGSPRKNGSTAYILHKFEEILLQRGAEVLFFDLSEQDIAFCKGCCACYKLGKCVINDDADMISAKLREADGVIIGTSTIASNVSGVLKSFIDRGHFVIEQLLHKKYAVCVSTYGNYGGNDALKVLKSLVTLSGAYLCGAFAVKLPFNSDC